MNKQKIIYTDGACFPNPGKGGWCAIILQADKKDYKVLKGSEPETTNNRMELRAIEQALMHFEEPTSLLVYSDSRYCVDGINDWMHNWANNGWRRKKRPVKNADLWGSIFRLALEHKVKARWVRGHDGDYYNELADSIANEEAGIPGTALITL